MTHATSSSPSAGLLPPEPDAHVLRVAARDVDLPDGGGTLVVLTLTATDERRPTTLGPRGLDVLRDALLAVRDRAAAGEVAAVVVAGRPGCFVAGADLGVAAGLDGLPATRALAETGHATLRLLGELPVPTIAWITGHALGGGLELALHCDHRVAVAGVRSIGLPEVTLGIVPGWGGCWLLPRIVGLPAAVDLAVLRPLANNRLTTAEGALEIGLVDTVLPEENFEQAALAWTAGTLRAGSPTRRDAAVPPLPDGEPDPVARAAAALDARLHGAAPAYAHALDLLARAGSRDRDAGFDAEDDVLSALLLSDQSRASLYAAGLTGRGTRRSPAPGAGPEAEPAPVRRVGIVGAGLMAAQLAVLLGGRLGVPVAMREVDEERAAAGRDRVRDLVEGMARKGRLREADARALLDGIRVGTDLGDLADADLVIEAVTEVLDVKRAVLAELEGLVRPDCVLATNTSALSVTAMADGLAHPGRVVGLHFFNPVAQMPLVEVVATATSSETAVATAVDVARRAGKTVVRTTDRPGFVVNRVLLRMLADVLGAVEEGTPVVAADAALRPMGLPMSPFALLQLVGLPVARHVLVTLHDELGPRYPRSAGLDRLVEDGRTVAAPGPSGLPEVDPAVQDAFGTPVTGPRPAQEAQVRERVARGLAEEIGLLLDEGVVPSAESVDLAMLLGAGWPAHLGGICPWLDREGWSERVLGRRLLPVGTP